MRILRLRSYYKPETTSADHMSDDMDEAFVNNNIVNVVYTPMPTRGVSDEVRREYLHRRHEELYDGHIIVNRFPMFREGNNPVQRAFRYLCCNVVEFIKGIHEKDITLVHSGSTPPTQGLLSGIVAQRLSKKEKRKIPFVYNLQDIFPDSLVNSGITKKGSFIWKIGRRIENATYKRADKIIVINQRFKRNLLEKGVSEDKIVVISNWVDLNAVKPVTKENNTLFDEFGIDPSKYTIVYAGNLGETQGAEIIIEAAKQLIDNEEIQIVIFGGGAKYQQMQKRISEENVKNVFITGLLPLSRVSEVYSMGDLALITCKPGTGNAGMPSKTWSIMACNTPILASFDLNSELSDVLEESEAGYCVEPGNVEALSAAILEQYHNWKRGNVKAMNAREYALRTASKDLCVSRYVDVLVRQNDTN